MNREELFVEYKKDPRKFRDDLVSALNSTPIDKVIDLIDDIMEWDKKKLLGHRLIKLLESYHAR